jgi:hypothetical protein
MALSDSVSALTRDKFIPVLVDNIYNSNVLCLKLLKNAEKLDGGANIVIPIEYAKLGAGASGWIDYSTGATGVAEVETYQKATYQWATAFAGVKIPGEEELVNKGSSQVISLLKAKLKSAEKQIRDIFGTGLFAGTAVSNGLTTLNGGGTIASADYTTYENGADGIIETMPDATTHHFPGQVDDAVIGYQRTLGGIDSASQQWYAGNLGTFNLSGLINVSATSTASCSWGDLVALQDNVSNIARAMTRMYGACTVDNDQPDLIITTQAIYDAYETSLQANKRFAGSDEIANAGFDTLRFKGASVVVDSHCPAGQMYFLNTNYLDFKCHKDRMFEFENFRRLEASDNIQSRLFWMGQLTCSNPRMQGVLGGGPSDYS